jgi:hypothetical protein
VLTGLWRVLGALRRGAGGGLPIAVADVPDGLGASLEGAAPLPGLGWQRALAGLEGYRGAVIAKVVLVLVTAAGLTLAAVTRSPHLGQALLLGGPSLDFVISVFLIAGLVGFSSVPAESGARATAQLGVASAALSLLVQVYVAFLLYTLLGDGPGDDRYRAEAALPKAQMFAQVIALGGMLLLLASFRALAVCLERRDVVERLLAVTFGVMACIGAVVGLHFLTDGGHARGAEGLLVVGGVVVLAIAITTLVGYLSVLRALTSELRTRLARAP